jgi:hypothetical protein
MLWSAAQDYSSRKRMQRRNEQKNKKGEERKIRIRDCIEALSAAWLNIIFSIIFWG